MHLDRTGVALMRTNGARDRAGVALQRTGDPPDRTGGAIERPRHVLHLEPAAAHTAGPLMISLSRLITLAAFISQTLHSSLCTEYLSRKRSTYAQLG